jgi:hypothetical protein
MEELTKRIENMRKELQDLEALKAKYEANPMQYLEDEISFMRAQKHITVKQIINTIINHVKTHGFD